MNQPDYRNLISNETLESIGVALGKFAIDLNHGDLVDDPCDIEESPLWDGLGEILGNAESDQWKIVRSAMWKIMGFPID